MNSILNRINEKEFDDPSRYEGSILLLGKKGLWLLYLGENYLCGYEDKIYTFRTRLSNLVMSDIGRIADLNVHSDAYDLNFAKSYFDENKDNPFALKYILTLMVNGITISKDKVLTQFPPLEKKPEKEVCLARFELMKKKLQPKDAVLMYDRNSGISKKIRDIDKTQWSHLATMYTSRKVMDMTTSGLIEYDVSELDPINYDIALYRHIDNIGLTSFDDWYIRCQQLLSSNMKYNWTGIFKAYLFRKFRFFRFLQDRYSWRDTTPSDILNSNTVV